MKPTQVWIFHGFNKNFQVADSLIRYGITLSFGTAVIKNKNLQEVVSKVNISSLLLETDDAINYNIKEVYQKVSELKNIEVEELQQKIKQNFKNIFKRWVG